MRQFLLLLVLALVAFASSDALSAPTSSDLQLSKSEINQAVQSNIDGKRMLRANDGTDAADEERGMTELATKLKSWAQSFKTWITNSQLVQTVSTKMQSSAQKRQVAKAEGLIKLNADDALLFKNKISPGEYFLALKLDPKLKFYTDVASVRAANGDLEKFFNYAAYYNLKSGVKP